MNLLIEILLPFIIILIAAFVYFKIAAHYKIVDNPNERSSHTVATIRGGGIIFILSTILFFFWNGFAYPYLLASILISGAISFIDDIRTVNNRLKFSMHILSVLLVFKESGLLVNLSPIYLVIVGIVVIGIINAYNFMDGINGITGLYSLALMLPLFFTESNELLKSLELFSIIGLVIFNFFNSRKKARCFAGDVGSISMAILVVFLLIMRIQQTSQFAYIGFLLVYGVDTVYTIMQRLYQRENIFKPHRKHLYQYLCNEKKVPHLWISIVYAGLQLALNFAISLSYINNIWLLILFIILSVMYWVLKLAYIKLKLTKTLSQTGDVG